MVKFRTWSDADNARLLQLEAEKVPREEIAQRLRKTRQQVNGQIGRLRMRQNLRERRANARGIVHGAPWLADEIERLLALGHTARLDEWPAIAETHFPGRTAKACKQQYYNCRAARASLGAKAQLQEPEAAAVPVRAHRAETREPQSITAAVFGDPPPGRSALDQRAATKSSVTPSL
jgi:hypothetical protein